MSVEKSELKAAFAHAIGCDADDDLAAAEKDIDRYSGQAQASKLLEQRITAVVAKLKADQDSDSPPFRNPEEYQAARRYLAMCLSQATTLSQASDNLRLQMEGKAMAFRHTIHRLSKIKADEERKAAAIANPPPDAGRQTGMRPGATIAEKRREEVRAAAK